MSDIENRLKEELDAERNLDDLFSDYRHDFEDALAEIQKLEKAKTLLALLVNANYKPSKLIKAAVERFLFDDCGMTRAAVESEGAG